MSLIIHAANVHQGGGRTLLCPLLNELKKGDVAILDLRLDPVPAMDSDVRVIKVKPTLISRFLMELKLSRLCNKGDTLLCFGNLPPLFRNKARVFVYLQNRYLSSKIPLTGMNILAQIRIKIERLWLAFCLRDCVVLVQTQTMAKEVLDNFGRVGVVRPFLPVTLSVQETTTSRISKEKRKYDFIYVASGEPHKNHHNLLKSWILLARRDLYPSLCLTLDKKIDQPLIKWIEKNALTYSLKITVIIDRNIPVDKLFLESTALIYPSLFESFGLPLLEADRAGLAIIASEKDYVREVVNPQESFDPESPVSIASAVQRFLGVEKQIQISSPKQFLDNLLINT